MGQLCRVTDPRGATTGFTYAPVFLGPARVATVTDRRGSVTTVFYSGPPAADFVAVDQAGRRQLFLGIDSAGRVADRYEGTTANVWLHHDTFTWDRVGIATTCRQPDGFVDNNLCRVVRSPSWPRSHPTPTPGSTYNNEGRVLAPRTANAGGDVVSSAGHDALYVQSDGPVVVADRVGAGGSATSGARPAGAGTTRTLFVVSDQTRLSPSPPGATPPWWAGSRSAPATGTTQTPPSPLPPPRLALARAPTRRCR